MNYIYLGKIVNTHGIKGEIRILSNFSKKELAFKVDMPIYIGRQKIKMIIHTYRKHKNFDMVTLDGITDINEALKYKEEKVYINRSDLNLGEEDYLLDDLLNFSIICDEEKYGYVNDIYDNGGNILLEIEYQKKYYIPYKSNYIKKIDLSKKIIYTENIKELIL